MRVIRLFSDLPLFWVYRCFFWLFINYFFIETKRGVYPPWMVLSPQYWHLAFFYDSLELKRTKQRFQRHMRFGVFYPFSTHENGEIRLVCNWFFPQIEKTSFQMIFFMPFKWFILYNCALCVRIVVYIRRAYIFPYSMYSRRGREKNVAEIWFTMNRLPIAAPRQAAADKRIDRYLKFRAYFMKNKRTIWGG